MSSQPSWWREHRPDPWQAGSSDNYWPSCRRIYREVSGGEGGIRTPDSLTTMSDFESGAFNRALPPLRDFILS